MYKLGSEFQIFFVIRGQFITSGKQVLGFPPLYFPSLPFFEVGQYWRWNLGPD